MKILFVMRSTVYVRNFESTLRMLAERGHHVHVVADVHQLLDPTDLIGRLAGDYPQITHGLPPQSPVNGWVLLGDELRRAVDYLRYLRPEYRDAPKLRQRAENNAPPFAIAAGKRPLVRSPFGIATLSAALRRLDHALPVDGVVMDFVRKHNPDLLIVTPLVEPGGPQAEYLRSARALGIRTALCVYSWDNLTNKGLIQDPLDLVTVWNEPMRDEAVTLHGVPPERVVVTGAAPYDHWFDWKPRHSREEFCTKVGLPVEQPYLLYLCSSKFIAPLEVPFVRRWIAQLRSASPLLARTAVLIRPHPQNVKPWRDVDLRKELDAVSLWPRGGSNPVDADSRAEYYDSIFYSAGVVGVNTSAQIESAIVGRGVYTVLAPEFRDTQEGTLHFKHLRSVNGGLLHVAADFPEHVKQLEAAVLSGGADDGRCRRFIEAFVRPHGIDVPATPKLVAAIEGVASLPMIPRERPRWYTGLVRSRLRARTLQLAQEEEARQREELERQQGKERKANRAKKQGVSGNSEAVPRETPAQDDVSRGKKSAARRRAGIAGTQRDCDAVGIFADVRDRVQAMKAAAGATSRCPHLAPLWDATPETISKLRHVSHLVGGSRPGDYVNVTEETAGIFWSDFRKLRREGGTELMISEPRALGGFGFERHEQLFNGDTLRFYELLTALKLAAVLPLFSAAGSRRIVFDIGGGWGGFAYQFKSLFPNVTYVISADPDAFLLSATYIRFMFPEARIHFHGEGGDVWRGLEDVDFIFLPESTVSAMTPSRLDLAIDLFGLDQLGTDDAEGHVRRVSELGAPYFYSAVLDNSKDRDASVRSLLERFYWLHALPVPQFRKRTAFSGWPPSEPDGPRATRTHVIGWRKLVL